MNASQQKLQVGAWSIQPTADSNFLQFYKGSTPPKSDQSDTPLVMMASDGNIWTNRSSLKGVGLTGWLADSLTMTRANDTQIQANLTNVQNQVNASQQKLQVGAWSIQPTADSNFLQFYKGSTPPKSDQSDTPLVMMASDGNIWTNRSSLKGEGLTGWLADSLTMTRANDTQIQANLTNLQNQVNASQQKLQQSQTPGQKYPPALTANTCVISGQSYGNGTYVVSVATNSRSYGRDNAGKVLSSGASVIFNGNYWGVQVYNSNTGQYGGTVTSTSSGTTFAGEWLSLQLPNPITAVSFYVNQNGTLCKVVLAGSNDGTIWTTLFNGSVISSSTSTITSPGSYSYYRWTWLNAPVTELVCGQLYLQSL